MEKRAEAPRNSKVVANRMRARDPPEESGLPFGKSGRLEFYRMRLGFCFRAQMPPRRITLLFLLLAARITAASDLGFSDDFSATEHPTRQALRGEWVYENGVASCGSDPVLYKKFKNHGPILRWPCELVDGVLEFEVKAEGCQRLVITFNGDGHVFRVTMRDDDGSQIIGWIGRSSKENKGDHLAEVPLPKITEIDGEWVDVKLTMADGKGHLKIGDYEAELDHGSLARVKQEFTISFASGSCAVRGVKVTPNVSKI